MRSVWYSPNKPKRSRVTRSQPFWWRQLKLMGLCSSCWKVRDRPGTLCRCCCERAKLRKRIKDGWDGISEWKPKAHSRNSRHYVGCSLPDQDYRQLIEIAQRQGVKLGSVVREAVQLYVGDISEGIA